MKLSSSSPTTPTSTSCAGATSRSSCRSSLTVASLALVGVRGLNLGVDFVGGQMIRVDLRPAGRRRAAARPTSMRSTSARPASRNSADRKTYQIRLPKPEGGEAAANRVGRPRSAAMLEQRYPGARVDRGRIGVGQGQRGAGLATARWRSRFAMLGIAIYIWFRFEWQFGVGALVTLFHDVSMTLGFFALTQLQVDLNVVAAILTIVGYSLNDTVVIYDRIRENLRKYRKMAIVPLLNLSLNETLSRTMVTSLSILLALGVLLLLGPEVIFGLTIAIFLGIFVGTYSSIYISVAGAGLAGGQARQLPPSRGRRRPPGRQAA